MTNHSGKDGHVTVSGNDLPVISWGHTPNADTVQFRHSLSGNFEGTESTFKSSTGTVTIEYDYDSNPFAAPVALFPGVSLTNLKLIINRTANKFWLYPSVVVTSTPQSCEINGRVQTSFSFRANGTYSAPA